MSPPVQPVQDFADYAALANRIAQHLRANPKDAQARSDLKYLKENYLASAGEAENEADWAATGGKESAHPGYDVLAGASQAVTDIPKGIANLFIHPQRSLFGDVDANAAAFNDPESNWAAKTDAVLRTIPGLNMGYGAERSLMEATGANPYSSNDPNYGEASGPASLQEVAHRVGNVASLGLLGLGAPARGPGTLAALREGDLAGAAKLSPPLPGSPTAGSLGMRLAGRVVGKIPYVGPIVKAVGRQLADIQSRYGSPTTPPEPPPEPLPPVAERGLPPVHPDAVQAMRDFEAGKITGHDLRTAMDLAAGREPEPFQGRPAVAPTVPEEPPRFSDPQPIPGAPQGMSVIGPPTPPKPTAPTVAEMQPQIPRAATDATMARVQRGATQGQLEYRQAALDAPPASPAPASPPLGAAQLKLLLAQSPEEFEASKGMFPPDVIEQVRSLRDAGATPAHVDASVSARQPPEGGFQNTAAAMAHPAYRQASVLAGRILKSPALAAQFPQFAGASAADATATLQRMILEHAQRGGEIPPLTSLPKFLARLSP